MKQIFYSFAILLFLFGCKSNQYVSENNYRLSKKHRTVAILPVTVHTTGNLPKDLSANDIRILDSIESRYFQDVIYRAIQRKNKEKNPYWVTFVPNRTVNLKLFEKGISAQNINHFSIDSLSKILEVDGVILGDVRKERYMSETASAAVNIGEEILESIFDVGIFVPGFADRTYQINLQLEVYDAKSETIIYDRRVSDNIDYRWSPAESVSWLSRRIGKKFPYREYNY